MVPNFCEDNLTSFCDSVYTCPVLVRGSTVVKTSYVVSVTVLSDGGYLKEFDGPGSCSNFTLTWLSSGVR